MLQSHKIKLQMSEARERLAVLAAKDDPNDDEAKEMKDLTGKYQLMETRYQASLTSEIEEDKKAAVEEPGELDAESREFHEKVTPNVKMADYLTFAAEGKAPEGAAAEMNAALEVGGVRQVDGKPGVEFPLFLLDPGDDGSGKYEFAATSLTLDTIRRRVRMACPGVPGFGVDGPGRRSQDGPERATQLSCNKLWRDACNHGGRNSEGRGNAGGYVPGTGTAVDPFRLPGDDAGSVPPGRYVRGGPAV